MQRRIGECINSSFEWLVWEDHGALLGFAYYSRFKERRAYDYACETAIYVRHGFLGKGIGLALYRQLIARLKKSKQAIAVACITVPNEASIGLHEELGFQNCGIIRNAGRKFGTWLDIGYWVLELKNLPEYEPEEMEPAGQDSRSAAQR
jgi:phosphinothricin acetyltransferase